MASEGSREIKAAKQRLTAAKTQAALAKAMSEAAEKEVKAAEECLKGAEKRWEVIDVDYSDDESHTSMESCKKRRKVSLSPGGRNGDARASADGATVRQTGGTATAVRKETRKKSQILSCIKVVKIVVEGCGMSEVNGTYRQDGCITGNQRRIRLAEDVPVFFKMEEWEGKPVTFVMARGKYTNDEREYWWIGHLDSAGRNLDSTRPLYVAHCSAEVQVPPSHGWTVMAGLYGKGVSPAPKLKVLCLTKLQRNQH